MKKKPNTPATEDDKDTELSINHLQFCLLAVEYKFKGGQRRAYREVYSNKEKPLSDATCDVNASRLLSSAKIKAKIKQIYDDLENNFTISKREILGELAKIAFADIRNAFDDNGRLKPISEIPNDIAAALAGVEVFEESEKCDGMVIPIGETKKIKIAGKTEALRLMCDILGHKAPQKIEGDLSINWTEERTYEGDEK